MSLVDKFSNFEVKTEERVSAEDKNYLDKLQELYDGTLTYYRRVFALYNEEKRKYTNDVVKLIGNYNCVFADNMDVNKRACELQIGFTNQIYSYFCNKYKITIENDNKKAEEKKYDSYKYYGELPKELIDELYERQTYDTVLDDIIQKLGGMTFNELSVQQIKDRMKKAAFCYDKWRIEVKNATVKFDGAYVSKEWYQDKYKVHRGEFLAVLPDALSLFMIGSPNCCHMGFMRKYEIELDEDEMKQGIEFPSGLKLKSMKFFKNGRLDMKFETPEYARAFAREYCGYTMV